MALWAAVMWHDIIPRRREQTKNDKGLFYLKYLGNACIFFFYVNSVTPRKWDNAHNMSLFLQHFILWEFPKKPSKNLSKNEVNRQFWESNLRQFVYSVTSTLLRQLCLRQLCLRQLCYVNSVTFFFVMEFMIIQSDVKLCRERTANIS